MTTATVLKPTKPGDSHLLLGWADPHDLVTLDELAISTMWETSALVEVLKRKGNYGERFSSNGCEVRPSCSQYHTTLLSRVLRHYHHHKGGIPWGRRCM